MGEHTETVAADTHGKDNRFRSSETNNVGVSPQEDRSRSESAVGDGQGAGEEGGVVHICKPDWLLR
jgi:hypothetical protein